MPHIFRRIFAVLFTNGALYFAPNMAMLFVACTFLFGGGETFLGTLSGWGPSILFDSIFLGLAALGALLIRLWRDLDGTILSIHHAVFSSHGGAPASLHEATREVRHLLFLLVFFSALFILVALTEGYSIFIFATPAICTLTWARSLSLDSPLTILFFVFSFLARSMTLFSNRDKETTAFIMGATSAFAGSCLFILPFIAIVAVAGIDNLDVAESSRLTLIWAALFYLIASINSNLVRQRNVLHRHLALVLTLGLLIVMLGAIVIAVALNA